MFVLFFYYHLDLLLNVYYLLFVHVLFLLQYQKNMFVLFYYYLQHLLLHVYYLLFVHVLFLLLYQINMFDFLILHHNLVQDIHHYHYFEQHFLIQLFLDLKFLIFQLQQLLVMFVYILNFLLLFVFLNVHLKIFLLFYYYYYYQNL